MTELSPPLSPPLSSPASSEDPSPGAEKLLYLMNDFVVQEHTCNLRCKYCLNFENENLKDDSPWHPLERVNLQTGGEGWNRGVRVLEACRQRAHAPILRVAGGEIMAIKGSLEFIAAQAGLWDRIQVMTNATFLERDIDRLRDIEGLNLCCSVDGHTVELNRERSENPLWAQRIIDGLLCAVDAGIPVEVYTVLTEHNADALHEFAHWLLELPRRADLRLLPFPVRGEVRATSRPRPEQFGSLQRLIEDYDLLAAILPPRAFLERLYGFCVSGTRDFRCRVPVSFVQTFDDGVVACCSNCWATPLGNLLEDQHVFRQVGEANIHKLFLRDPPRFPFCRTCFTPFDVVNVYLDGLCELDEIRAMDLYSSPAVGERLKQMKDAWSAGKTGGLWATELDA